MTKADQEKYRETLLALRARLNGNLSHLTEEALRTTGSESGGNLSHAPLHMADLGTDSFEQEFTLNLLQNGEQALDEINSALRRLDAGTYGRCEECGAAIPKARLQALPYARHCLKCAREAQQSA
jgi:DnaK suppressor protein